MGATAAAALDTKVFDQVIEEGDVTARKGLAVQLAGLLADPEAPAAEKEAVVPSLLRLATDPVAEVRRILASELKDLTAVHPDVLFTIVADDDSIALPFLAETQSLDAWRMLAVLQVGDQARQLVIAARPDLTPEAVSEIAARGSLEIVAALLDNPACHVPGSDYRRLYVRFRDEGEIVERLLARKDLPLEVRILQARRASSRIHALVVERGWIAANDAEAIIADAQETTVLRILETARPQELDRLIPFLCKRDMLNASIVLRAACRGQMLILERALAFLSSMPMKHVHGLIGGQATLPLKALFNAAGLPQGSYMLLRASIDMWREARAAGEAIQPDTFSRRVVESLMTRYAGISAEEKVKLLDLVARLADERTKAIAERLKSTLQQQAA